jgi:GT2 family glycosyltransferase
MSNPSFASLCNFAFAESSSEYVLIANDKSRPEQSDIQKILLKLKEGFGIVGLYRFGFFGVSRELINEMGGFDTRFVDGGYEDNDLLLRFKELDIAVYMQEEIKYVTGKISLWRQENSSKFFWEKYKINDVNCEIFQTIQHEVQPNKLKIKK